MQKGESKTGGYQKTMHDKFPEKQTISRWYAQVHKLSGGKKCSSFWKIWSALFSCNHRFEIPLFDLLLTSWRRLWFLSSTECSLQSCFPHELSKVKPRTYRVDITSFKLLNSHLTKQKQIEIKRKMLQFVIWNFLRSSTGLYTWAINI